MLHMGNHRRWQGGAYLQGRGGELRDPPIQVLGKPRVPELSHPRLSHIMKGKSLINLKISPPIASLYLFQFGAGSVPVVGCATPSAAACAAPCLAA